MPARTPKALRNAFARAGRRRETQLRRREARLVAPTWLMAAATSTVAGIAIYGVFFTSIPEALIRQLRSEVVIARVEVAEVREQKRKLEEDLAGFETQIANERAQLVALKEQRDDYLLEVWTLSTRSFAEAVRSELAEISTDDRQRVVDYLDIKAWKPKEIEWQEKIDILRAREALAKSSATLQELVLETIKAVREKLAEQPSALSFLTLRSRFRERNCKDCDAELKSARSTTLEVLDAYLQDFEESEFFDQSGPHTTLKAIVASVMTQDHLARLLPDAQRRFREIVDLFAERRTAALSAPLDYRLSPGTKTETQQHEIEDNDERLRESQQHINALETKLFDGAPIGD